MVRRALVPLAVLLSAFAIPHPALAATEVLVRSTAKTNEFRPAVSTEFRAWTQESGRRPRRLDVMAQRADDKPFRVNPFGDAVNGGLDGSRLVYELRPERAGSEIRLYDLDRRRPLRLPKIVNTRQNEYAPSLSGDHLLFGRSNLSVTRRAVWLVDLRTGERRQLASMKGERSFLAIGQLNAGFATWQRCAPGGPCDVFRYQIATGTTLQVPNPSGALQYSPGVASDGTVYFFRSGVGCGNEAAFMKWSGTGDAVMVLDFPDGVDATNAFVYQAPTGREIYYARYECGGRGGRATTDLYKLIE